MFGYVFQRTFSENAISKKHLKIILCIDILVFVILLSIFSRDCYIYTTQIYLFGSSGWMKQIIINIYRWAIGFAGSLFVILTLYFCDLKRNCFARRKLLILGKNTLGIYIISTFFNSYGFKIFYTFGRDYFYPNVILWCLETVLILMLCVVVSNFIKKIVLLNKCLLGGR